MTTHPYASHQGDVGNACDSAVQSVAPLRRASLGQQAAMCRGTYPSQAAVAAPGKYRVGSRALHCAEHASAWCNSWKDPFLRHMVFITDEFAARPLFLGQSPLHMTTAQRPLYFSSDKLRKSKSIGRGNLRRVWGEQMSLQIRYHAEAHRGRLDGHVKAYTASGRAMEVAVAASPACVCSTTLHPMMHQSNIPPLICRTIQLRITAT